MPTLTSITSYYTDRIMADWERTENGTTYVMPGTGDYVNVYIKEVTYLEYPGKVFGLWSEEAIWMRNRDFTDIRLEYNTFIIPKEWEVDEEILWKMTADWKHIPSQPGYGMMCEKLGLKFDYSEQDYEDRKVGHNARRY